MFLPLTQHQVCELGSNDLTMITTERTCEIAITFQSEHGVGMGGCFLFFEACRSWGRSYSGLVARGLSGAFLWD